MNVESHRVVRPDLNVGVQFSDRTLRCCLMTLRQIEAEDEASGGGSACLEEAAAIELLDNGCAHSAPPVVSTFDPGAYRAAR